MSQSIAPPAPEQRAFLASSTDDLECREVELRSYLEQALKVLPSPLSVYLRSDLATHEVSMGTKKRVNTLKLTGEDRAQSGEVDR